MKPALSKSPTLSIVIVSWNVARLLTGCLESIQREATDLPAEVVVVDNASSDCTVEMLRSRYPWVNLIANGNNPGFARGNNQGFAICSGRYLLFLNPDTVVNPHALVRMAECLDREPGVGMVGPKLLSPDGSVQFVCARKTLTLRAALWCEALHFHHLPLVGRWFYRTYLSPYDFEKGSDVEAISGAAMMIRREIYEKIGGFGESYIHCGEDLDLCFKVRRSGSAVRYLAEAEVRHYGGQSSQQASVRTWVNAALSNQEFFRQTRGAASALAYRLLVQVIQAPVLVFLGIAKFLLRRESTRGLGTRVRVAMGLMVWKPVMDEDR